MPRRQAQGPMTAGQQVRQNLAAWISLLLLLVAPPSIAQARVVAVLKSDNLAAYGAPLESFARGIDARLVVYELDGDLEKGKKIAQQLELVPPDLILALGAKAAYSAKKYVLTVPIVYAMVINPEKYQLNQPNVTGITVEVPTETVFTQYRMFVPEVSKIGVIYGPATADIVRRAEKTVAGLGITLVATQIADEGEVADAFDRIKNSIDSLWMVPDPIVMTGDTFRLLIERTRTKKIPFFAYSENFVRAGALMSVSPDYVTIGSQAAAIAKQILADGVSPSSIPTAGPIGTHLTINLETARALELRIDPLVLAFADELIGALPNPGSTGTKP